MDSASNAGVGAYGLRINGLEEARALLVPAPPSWPLIEIEFVLAERSAKAESEGDRATLRFTSDGAEAELSGGTRVVLDRTARRAIFSSPVPLRQHELVHPYLGAVSAVFARWLGREAFHAGGFACDGAGWGVLAEREGGKSSLLAWLADHGAAIVADDMLVVEQDRVFAGPRSIDLREEPARMLGMGEPLGVVGVRERWRHQVPAVPPELPLRGWIHLRWGDTLEARPLPAGERLATLAAHVAIARAPENPRVLLELAALPAFELRRPKGWSSFEATGAALLDLVT